MSTVLVYSDDPETRERVILAVGRRPDPEGELIDWREAADAEAVIHAVDSGDIDVCVLDGEAWPTGGMGLSRQLRNEVEDCPAMIVLLGRRDDVWLGKWSLADAALGYPPDPEELGATLARLLRARASRLPAERSRFGLRRR
jgi:DNA-binding response OmpR family regulator